MPSLAERIGTASWRAVRAGLMTRATLARAIERTLRLVALWLVATALWRSVTPRDTRPVMHVLFGEFPTPLARDSLRALMRSGTRVSWSSVNFEPLVVSAERQREPGAPVRIAVVATGATELRDVLGLLDTVRGAGVLVGVEPSGSVSAEHGMVRGTVGVGAAPEMRPVLVVGRASWEAKFVVAALEEQGWTVLARLAVAPGVDVTQGRALALDTAHYAAVVALDTTLGEAGPRLAQFVRAGGGLVLAADAADAAAVRALAPARAGTRRTGVSRDPASGSPLDGVPLFGLESLRRDAVQLASRGALIAVAARREGNGRVLQVGYDETWRWRMQGGDGAVAAHREWWSRAVGSVAFATTLAAASGEGAPVARLVDALGPPTVASRSATPTRRLPAWLLPTLLAIMLGEWASRRIRGVP